MIHNDNEPVFLNPHQRFTKRKKLTKSQREALNADIPEEDDINDLLKNCPTTLPIEDEPKPTIIHNAPKPILKTVPQINGIEEVRKIVIANFIKGKLTQEECDKMLRKAASLAADKNAYDDFVAEISKPKSEEKVPVKQEPDFKAPNVDIDEIMREIW